MAYWIRPNYEAFTTRHDWNIAFRMYMIRPGLALMNENIATLHRKNAGIAAMELLKKGNLQTQKPLKNF